MAKIIRVCKRRYKPFVSQTLSALIIIAAIVISYIPINIIYKIICYAICFLLNFKLVNLITYGQIKKEER